MTTLGHQHRHHHPALRTHRVRSAGVALLLGGLALAGCGDSESTETAQDPPASASPTTSPSASPSASPPSPTAAESAGDTVTILSGTAAGGTVDLAATPLDDPAAVQEFVAQFRATGLPDQVTTAVAAAKVPAGSTLWGAVVAVGCDVPPAVEVSAEGDGVVLTPQKVPSPLPECLAAVTSVALAVVADR